VLDLKQIRENPDIIQELLNRRSTSKEYTLQPILTLDQQQRELEASRSQLQARSNEIGKIVGQMKSQGITTEMEPLKTEGNQIKEKLASLEPQEKEIKAQIEKLLLQLPNLPSASTPIGKNETENV
jgi:seryl-tRNA synthetase